MIERISPRKEVEYFMPTEVVFGRNTLRNVADEKKIIEANKIALIVGEHFKKSNSYTLLKEKLSKAANNLIVYEDLIKTSDFDTVNSLTIFLRQNQPDAVIAVGGGTILDTAKCAAILANNSGRVQDYLLGGKKIVFNGICFITIPTTAGTGSEVTPWAVVWDYENHEKYSLSSPLMFPSLAIVDPSLTDELPSKITAETGMDALTQAIEAYWSKSHNPTSDKFALESITLVIEYLPIVVNHPNQNGRDMMSKASLLAGLAFSNTKTTICHSISYPITIHWGVVHGQAVSITLPVMMEYSFPDIEEKRRNMLLSAIGTETTEEAVKKIENLMKSIGLVTKLSGLGLTEKDIDTIVNEGYNPDRMNNAPRVPSPDELRQLLKKIL